MRRGLKFVASAAEDITSGHLPRLPVPSLHHTVTKFTAFARPLQSDVEFANTLTTANDFMKSEEAEKLHHLLEERAHNMVNWLTPWWLEEEFLSKRIPLPVSSSPAMTLPKINYSGVEGQAEAAAKIIQAALKFYIKIVNNELPRERLGESLLCMNMYRRMFGTTRVPAHGKDVLMYGSERNPQPTHIIVLRKGHIFRLPVFDSDGKVLSIGQLKNEIMTNIIPKSDDCNRHPIAVVSSDERGIWADVYGKLREKNMDRIHTIEDSLFAVCLDQKMTHIDGSNDIDIQTIQCLHGGGCHNNSINRWFDKTLQFIVGMDGYCGLTLEQSPTEGLLAVNLVDFICDEMKHEKFDTKDAAGSFEPAKGLSFSVPDDLNDVITQSKANIDRLAADTDVKVFTFDHFGKDFIKSHGISPDSFLQIGMQVAYFRIYGKLACTSETATLRKFSEGRTETIRLPNFHSAMFTIDATDPDSAEEIPPAMMASMFRVAAQQHKKHSLEAMNGKGMDRHLFGLRKIAAEHGRKLPVLFETEAYKKMMAITLSTAQVPARNNVNVSFGPSAPDCYDICYNPQQNQVQFTICASHSCLETSSTRYAEELENALVDMRSIITKADEEVKK